MADPYSIEARMRLGINRQGRIPNDKVDEYHEKMQELKDEGWEPPMKKPTNRLSGLFSRAKVRLLDGWSCMQ
jgi:hypothetical protein